ASQIVQCLLNRGNAFLRRFARRVKSPPFVQRFLWRHCSFPAVQLGAEKAVKFSQLFGGRHTSSGEWVTLILTEFPNHRQVARLRGQRSATQRSRRRCNCCTNRGSCSARLVRSCGSLARLYSSGPFSRSCTISFQSPSRIQRCVTSRSGRPIIVA